MGHTAAWRSALDGLLAELEGIVGARLRALLVYEAHGLLGDIPGWSDSGADPGIRHEDLVHTLAIVEDLGLDDLTRLAPLAPSWERRQLAVPLLLAPRDLARSLDSFPLEFAQILARHELVFGSNPFEGLRVERQDLRRACETQARSHLLHLREGYLQTGGDARAVAELVAASAAPLRALLVNIARLHGLHVRGSEELVQFVQERLGLPGDGLRPLLRLGARLDTLKGPQTADVFPRYFEAVEHLARLVDEWAL